MASHQRPSADDLAALRSHYERFMPLTGELWNALSSDLQVELVKKGEIWLEAGRVCPSVGFVAEGLLRTFYVEDGQEKVRGFFYAPEFVTEYGSFLTQSPSHVSIVAMEDSRILTMSYDRLQTLYAEQGEEGQKLGRLIAEALFIQFNFRVISLILESPEQRYIKFAERSPHLLQRIPLYHIASYLDMTPETLSRIRSRIAKRSETSS